MVGSLTVPMMSINHREEKRGQSVRGSELFSVQKGHGMRTERRNEQLAAAAGFLTSLEACTAANGAVDMGIHPS